MRCFAVFSLAFILVACTHPQPSIESVPLADARVVAVSDDEQVLAEVDAQLEALKLRR